MQYRPYHCRCLFVPYRRPYFIRNFLYPRSVWSCFSPTINTVLKLVFYSSDRSIICNSSSSSILCGYDSSVGTDRRLKCKLVRVNTTSSGTNRNYSIVTFGGSDWRILLPGMPWPFLIAPTTLFQRLCIGGCLEFSCWECFIFVMFISWLSSCDLLCFIQFNLILTSVSADGEHHVVSTA